MARISKADHPRILEMIDCDSRKVADVAAEFGCTPANLYALLGKLRRAAKQASPAVEAAAAVEQSDPPVPSDLFAAAEIPDPGAKPAKAARIRAPAAEPAAPPSVGLSVAETPVSGKPALEKPVIVASAPAPVSATVTGLPRRGASRGMGAALAKPGFGLHMRTAEGEENLTPFRSLDDLLSAIKPILRAAARSPDAVWFSITPIDLALVDSDAA